MMDQWQFHWSWLIAPWALVLGLFAILVWVVFFYLRESNKLADQDPRRLGRFGIVLGLTVIRLLVLGLLVVLWFEPTIEQIRMGKPALVVLLDRSASMNHIDPPVVMPGPSSRQQLPSDQGTEPSTQKVSPKSDLPSRFTRMIQYLLAGQPSCLDRLEESYHVELIAFAEQFQRLEPTQSQGLRELLRSLPPAVELLQNEGAPGEGNRVIGNKNNRLPAATRLGEVVDFALQPEPEMGFFGAGPNGNGPAVVVLLSDGIGTLGKPLAAAAERAREQGIPLYTVAIGSEQPLADVALDRPIAASGVFLGDALTVETMVRAVGLSGQSARVILRDTANGKILDQAVVLLPSADEGKQIRLQARATQAGRLSLELQIELLPAAQQSAYLPHLFSTETNLENNRQLVEVRVHDDPIRVLLVQSSPSYEFRALKEMLQRDPAVQLSVWLQQADRQFAAVDSAALSHFPLLEQQLFAYDVVIWGDVDPEPIAHSFWPRLLRWVNHQGGGLALLAGPQFLPQAYQTHPELALLLPIQPTEGSGRVGTYVMQPTVEGLRDPALWLASTSAASQAVWNELPSFTWLWNAAQVKPGAQCLLEATSLTTTTRWPVVLRHFVGAGEVLMHLTDETWRLRYRTDGRIFARYWGQAVRRLARGKRLTGSAGVKLTTDAREYRSGVAVHVRAQFYDPAQAPAEGPIELQWESSVQSRRSLELQRRWDQRGLFEATLRELPAGEHQLDWLPVSAPANRSAEHSDELQSQPLSATVQFKVHAPPRELARLAVDRQALSEAAHETHGKTYTLQSADRLPEELPPARLVPWEHLPAHRLASTHGVIGLLVGLLTIEWILRRRKGMM